MSKSETQRKHRRRHVWKTFYLESGRAYHEIQSVWQSWPRSGKSHKMFFDGGGCIETNVPVAHLRDIFRTADVRWVDYVSDTHCSRDERHNDD
jgi:hypothetical protein